MKRTYEHIGNNNGNKKRCTIDALPPRPLMPHELASFKHKPTLDHYDHAPQPQTYIPTLQQQYYHERTTRQSTLDYYNYAPQQLPIALPARPAFQNERPQQDSQTKWTKRITQQTEAQKSPDRAKIAPNKVSEDDLPSAITANSIEEIKRALPDHNGALIKPEIIKNIFDSHEDKSDKKHAQKLVENGTYTTSDGVVCKPLTKPPSPSFNR